MEDQVSKFTVKVVDFTYSVKAVYALQSTARLVQSNGTIITKKTTDDNSATAAAQDTIRVTLTCDDLQYVREIKIADN